MSTPMNDSSDGASKASTSESEYFPHDLERGMMGTNQDICDEYNEISNKDRLHIAVQDAGLNAFGVVAVDVWLLDENDGKFVHADGGWWRYKHFLPKSPHALERVENSSLGDYVPASPQIPGAGLAGYFWSLSSINDTSCTWIDIHTITSDPDQPPYLRTQILEEAGFGKATGVPFNIGGHHKGVVLYLARPTANTSALMDECNDSFLRFAAYNIGATSILNVFRKACAEARERRTTKKFQNSVLKFSAFGAFLGRMNNPVDEVEESPRKLSKWKSFQQSVSDSFRVGLSIHSIKKALTSAKAKTSKRCSLLVTKSAGGGLKPPPAMHTRETLWTFFGSLISLLILSRLLDTFNNGMKVLGPFGALMTLLYGLTPAPASQPRNALYGQSVSISIALLVEMCTFLPDWFRVPFAVSLAIAAMSKLGITHPPAGASAVIFSTLDVENKWSFFLLLLLGNVVVILLATLVNNLSCKRQYPIYWEFGVDRCVGWIKDHLRDNRKELESLPNKLID
eukprot:CAMPEP_0195287770 /NCGR_PEP_ID=MMETSP0707-20130614/4695_1 /TAXON_ID=33640 /ORGANISM="Asterionellopsis glacialis, Strain CCMP134" /LENGTH=510 /DNA_ID=CAMNT_0040347555 /DNA_START=149 /DNA_END=1681 /DNA_ORIENTATION=-